MMTQGIIFENLYYNNMSCSRTVKNELDLLEYDLRQAL